MAELLKRYYPRLVDVHNYIPGSSIAKKVDNWCTLNRKVLSKIEMKLSKETIDQLANSQPGVIESVLTDLRVKILKDCNADTEFLYSESEEKGKGGEKMISVILYLYSTIKLNYIFFVESARNSINPEVVANKTVPRHVFVKLKQELQEKKDAINILSEKVSHLESMLKLKDQRIKDLTTQIIAPLDLNLPTLALGNGIPKPRKSNV